MQWLYGSSNAGFVKAVASSTHGVRSILIKFNFIIILGGAVASCLVRSSPDRTGGIRALARDIVLCYCARHFTLTEPRSPGHGINGYRRI